MRQFNCHVRAQKILLYRTSVRQADTQRQEYTAGRVTQKERNKQTKGQYLTVSRQNASLSINHSADNLTYDPEAIKLRKSLNNTKNKNICDPSAQNQSQVAFLTF